MDNCVIPILLYGSGIWGSKVYKVCENVLLRACRFYCGVHRLAPIPAIQGDFGWWDIRSRWILESVRQYNRLTQMKNERINKKAFLWDQTLSLDNWTSSFKATMTDLDLLHFIENNTVIPLDLAKCKIKGKLERDWEHHCLTKDKLRTYRTFKTEMSTAAHLNCNLPKFQRSLISQLRLGILPIRIETGRFSGLKKEDRICQLCNSNAVEDEAHYMFHCDLYSDYRDELEAGIGAVFPNMGTTEKFCSVFEHPHALGRYLDQAFRKKKGKSV